MLKNWRVIIKTFKLPLSEPMLKVLLMAILEGPILRRKLGRGQRKDEEQIGAAEKKRGAKDERGA